MCYNIVITKFVFVKKEAEEKMIKDILGYAAIIGIILMFANGFIFKPVISAIRTKQYKALLVFFWFMDSFEYFAVRKSFK